MKTIVVTIITSFAITNANAVTTFTEDFDTGDSNWFGNTDPLTFLPADGAPSFSAGHVSTEFSFTNASMFGASTLFRGQEGFGSSGGAFTGNYIDDNVTSISFFVRHNAPQPVSFSARFASIANNPGGLSSATSILPDAWTLVSIDIEPDSFISFSGSDFDTVFSDIANIQVLASAPALGMDPTEYVFELDAVTVDVFNVPEPTTAILAFLGGFFLLRRKR